MASSQLMTAEMKRRSTCNWNHLEHQKLAEKLSTQMLSCIRASISAECALNLVTSGENYEIEVKKGAHTIKVPNGLLYLSILVSRIMID